MNNDINILHYYWKEHKASILYFLIYLYAWIKIYCRKTSSMLGSCDYSAPPDLSSCSDRDTPSEYCCGPSYSHSRLLESQLHSKYAFIYTPPSMHCRPSRMSSSWSGCCSSSMQSSACKFSETSSSTRTPTTIDMSTFSHSFPPFWFYLGKEIPTLYDGKFEHKKYYENLRDMFLHSTLHYAMACTSERIKVKTLGHPWA